MSKYNEIYIDDDLAIPPGYNLSELRAQKLKDVLMQEYTHKQYYRNWKCFMPWTSHYQWRQAHNKLIKTLWKKYKEVENA